MMSPFPNRVQETCTIIGPVNPYLLTGAVPGKRTFASKCANLDTFPYVAESVSQDGLPNGAFEIGIGTYNTATNNITRTTILDTSNNDTNPISWGGGPVRISIDVTGTTVANAIIANAVTDNLLSQSVGLSVYGRSVNSLGNKADIVGVTVGHVLQVLAGPTLGFGALSPAMELIEEANPAGTGAVTFSSLGAFTHLLIIFNARGTQAASQTAINLRFNGDAGANYDRHRTALPMTISFAEAFAQTEMEAAYIAAASATANYATGGQILIPHYRNTSFFKNFESLMMQLIAATSTNINERWLSGHWRNTAALASLTLTLASGDYVAGSKFSLYGIR